MIGTKNLNINLDIFYVAGGNYDLNYQFFSLEFRKYPDFSKCLNLGNLDVQKVTKQNRKNQADAALWDTFYY